MKLYITNKREFDKEFEQNDFNRNCLNQKQIHQKAFTLLSKKLTSDFSVPLQILVKFNDVDECVFNFENKNGRIYNYSFGGII
jgi:hypothetical protein